MRNDRKISVSLRDMLTSALRKNPRATWRRRRYRSRRSGRRKFPKSGCNAANVKRFSCTGASVIAVSSFEARSCAMDSYGEYSGLPPPADRTATREVGRFGDNDLSNQEFLRTTCATVDNWLRIVFNVDAHI